MDIVFIPKFDEIFPDLKTPTFTELLSEIPSSNVISILSWINSILHINPLTFDRHIEILEVFLERVHPNQIDDIKMNLHFASKKYPKSQMSIFPLITSLQFIEYEILHYRPGEFGQTSAKDELDIFKAFLLFNQKLDEKHIIQMKDNKAKSSKELPNEYYYKQTWPAYINQYEHTLTNNLLIQSFLAFDFLDFLVQNKKYSPFVRKYNELLNISDDQQYIKKILEIYINSYKMGGGKFIARFSPDVLKKNTVLENFIIEPSNISVEDYIKHNKHIDFKGMRQKPIVRFEDGFISVLNWKYMIDKLFQAFQFDFYHNSGIKKTVSFNDYKSDIGNEFAQKEIFEKFLDNTFSNSNGICLKDQDAFINFDYYYRIGNKIILIEFKDITLKYAEKYDLIKKDIDKKLIQEDHNNKSQRKGILQLVDNIIKIGIHYKEIDDFESYGIDKSRIIIYPVIVYTHKVLGMSGINDYLAERFAQEINNNDHGFFMIRELVMVDFELFINCHDAFKNGQVEFISLIDNYLKTLAYLRSSLKQANSLLAKMNLILSFEEVTSKIINKSCNFMESSLYDELKNRLFPNENN